MIAETQTPTMAIAAPDDINETSNTVVQVMTAIPDCVTSPFCHDFGRRAPTVI